MLTHPLTTGFAIVDQPQKLRLRSIILPWVEWQALDATEPFFDDFKIVDRPKPKPIPAGAANPVAWGSMLADVVDVYKRNCMVFRFVGNAILYHSGIHETRPVQEYHSGMARSGRIPAVQAIAKILTENLQLAGNDDDVPFRSPLEVLTTVAYSRGQRATVIASDELAVLFNLLAQAVGIPAWFVITGNKLTVECEVGQGRGAATVASFDPRTGRISIGPRKRGNNRLEFQSSMEERTGVSGPSYQTTAALPGRYPKELDGLVGTGNTERSRYWSSPRRTPSWYKDLQKARKSWSVGMHDPFLKKPVMRMQRTVVANNFGPRVTGAIIAYMTKIYVEQYGQLFRKIVSEELRGRGVDDVDALMRASNSSSQERFEARLRLADEIAKMIKDYFAYREEMWKVEEIISPLKQWELHAFRPHEQCHDCDDLSVNTMTCWEACSIPSAVRLAGDPGSNHQYHVYPLAVINGNAHVFDVSGLNIYREMPHGGNRHDFVPRNDASFMPAFPKQQGVESAVVAGCDCLRVVEGRKATLL